MTSILPTRERIHYTSTESGGPIVWCADIWKTIQSELNTEKQRCLFCRISGVTDEGRVGTDSSTIARETRFHAPRG
jgi:hypothetical protein